MEKLIDYFPNHFKRYLLVLCSYKNYDFILDFTNQTVECFAKSDLENPG